MNDTTHNSTETAIDLLFGGMHKLGPGGDAYTRQALAMLPERTFDLVVDVGCGTGRQTLVLAQELGCAIHAVDLHQPFLDILSQRAAEADVADRVQTHRLDMRDLAKSFTAIDLLWCEGAAYHLGFAHALRTWAPAIKRGGFVVLSDCTWLTTKPSKKAREFWAESYPEMATIDDNRGAAKRAGFRTVGTFTLPREAWLDGYYAVLGERARPLLEHESATVQCFAQDMLEEITLFDTAGESYGYVFYILESK